MVNSQLKLHFKMIDIHLLKIKSIKQTSTNNLSNTIKKKKFSCFPHLLMYKLNKWELADFRLDFPPSLFIGNIISTNMHCMTPSTQIIDT